MAGELTGFKNSLSNKHTLESRGLDTSVCAGVPGCFLCKRFVSIGDIGSGAGLAGGVMSD